MLLTFDQFHLLELSSATATSSASMARGVMDILVDEAEASMGALEKSVAELEANVWARQKDFAEILVTLRQPDADESDIERLIEIIRKGETENAPLDAMNAESWAKMTAVIEMYRPQLLSRVLPLFTRARNAARLEAETLRDTRWEAHAILADRDKGKPTREVSVSDLERMIEAAE